MYVPYTPKNLSLDGGNELGEHAPYTFKDSTHL